MAILRSCCWWNNVAYGSYGTAVYSFLIGGIFTIFVVFDIRPFHFFGSPFHGHAIGIGSYTQITGGVALCLSACVLVAGVYRNIKQLLLPWMVCMLLFTLVLVTGNIHLLIRKRDRQHHQGGNADVLIVVLSVVFCLLNVYGEVCVISHYQNLTEEYSKDGKEEVLPEKKSVSFFRRRNFSNSRTWNSYGPHLAALTRLPIRFTMPNPLFLSKAALAAAGKQDGESIYSVPVNQPHSRLKACTSSSESEAAAEVERDVTTPGPEQPITAMVNAEEMQVSRQLSVQITAKQLQQQLESLAPAASRLVVCPV